MLNQLTTYFQKIFMVLRQHISPIILGVFTSVITHNYITLSEGFVFSDLKIFGFIGIIIVGIVASYVYSFCYQFLNTAQTIAVNPYKKVGTQVTIYSFLAIIIYYIYYKTFWNNLTTVILEDPTAYPHFNNNNLIKLSIIITLIAFIYFIINNAHDSFQDYAHTLIKRTRLQRELVEAQMNTLKSQLRPHFLFNSLNTISSLAHSKPEDAEKYIRRLANNYNYA